MFKDLLYYDDLLFPLFTQSADVKTTETHNEISVVAPGLKKEDFKVEVCGNLLTISYDVSKENKTYVTSKKFRKEYTLLPNTNTNALTASYEQGVLKVLVPHPPKQPSKMVEVK